MYLTERIRAFFEGGSGQVFDRAGKEIPRDDLCRQYRSIRTYLRRHLEPGGRVAIRLPYDHQYLLSIYACMETGVTYIPLQPDWPDRRIDQIRRLAPFELLLDSSNLPQVLGTPPEDLPPVGAEALGAERALYVMFTSGSTGEPKGVVIPRRAYENFLRWMDSYFDTIGPEDRMLALTKFTFDIIGIDIGLLLLRRFHLYFSASEGNPFRLAREIQQHGITCLSTVPNNGMLLTSPDVLPRARLTSLRHLMLGGARFPYELLCRLRTKLPASLHIYNLYGPTEATIYTHVRRLDGAVDENHHKGNVTIGQPIWNVVSLIEGSDGAVVSRPFEEGEMLLGGVQVMLEYRSNPLKTAAVLDTRGGVRYYRTGDRSFFDDSGCYYVVGRMDECIKRRGYRIDLLDIDAYIQQLKGVRDCMTLAFDDIDAENLLLSVIIREGEVTAEDLRQQMREILLDYQIPDHIEFVESFPLNDAGKVSRKELTRIFQDRVRAHPDA